MLLFFVFLFTITFARPSFDNTIYIKSGTIVSGTFNTCSRTSKNQTSIYVKQGTTISNEACFSNPVTFEKKNFKKLTQIALFNNNRTAKTNTPKNKRASLINYPKPSVPITISDHSIAQGTGPTEPFQIKLLATTNTIVIYCKTMLFDKNSATPSNYYDSIKQHCFLKKEHARPPPKKQYINKLIYNY
ncbi:hypothetical protein OX284_010960 [Flavobacterium sp. SUN046]|uniref:hypothetical protein n=1 Tax=Flavobacterium sp. SUN046 TaxID=3002440 RepID=UPI002DB585F4|nr:hypothetical protein [Flavobacterium sp. SUN046]MEC4049950.1 hypothetical protein [Flavobacterium sp. SUN046]